MNMLYFTMNKMVIFMYFLVLNLQGVILIHAVDHYWMDTLVEHFNESKTFYQLMIFKNNDTSGIVEENYIFQKLGTVLPYIVIDLSKDTNKIPFLSVTKQTTVYIILQTSNMRNEIYHFEQIKANLNSLIELPFPSFHPKCLMISFTNSCHSETFFENILLYAWSKKFLDFSIIKISPTNVANLLYYDPFRLIQISIKYTSKVNLFPDKIINTYGYELKLPYIPKLPYITKGYNNTYGGTEFRIIKYIASILNLKLTILEYTKDDLRNVIRDIQLGVLNLLSFSMSVNHPVLRNSTELSRGKVFTFDSFCAAVSPNFHEKSATIYTPLKSMILIIFGIGCVIIIVILADRLKITKHRLYHYDIVRLILGASGAKQPKKTRDRFIFISIVFLSLTYLENIYSTFTDYELSYTEIPLKTFQDVLNSKLTPYMSTAGFHWIFEYPEQELSMIKHKIKLNGVENCIRQIIEGKAVICFTIKSKARMYQNMFKNVDGNSMIRIGQLKFMKTGKNFLFEPGFPLLQKFNAIIRRMAESGTLEHWFRTNKSRNQILADHKIDEDNYLIIPLITILIIGETSSLLIFCIELSYKYFLSYTYSFRI